MIFFSSPTEAINSPLSLPTISVHCNFSTIMSPKDQTPHGRSLLLAVEPPAPLSYCYPPNAPSTNRAPPRQIDHTYHDLSQFSFEKPHLSNKAPSNFPAKLHQILSTPECSHVSHYAMYLNQLLNFILRECKSFNCFLTPFCLIPFDILHLSHLVRSFPGW